MDKTLWEKWDAGIKLADLICNGSYDPETLIKALSTENLKGVCNTVEIPIPANTTKVYHYIFASLYHIHVA